VKAFLLFPSRDFEVSEEPGPSHQDLVRDLELGALLGEMAQGDRFLYDVSKEVMLHSLDDVEVLRYGQAVLADCIGHESLVREFYALVVGALEDKRGIWSLRSSTPSITLHGAVAQLEAFAVRLRALRKVSDDHFEHVGSEGLQRLLRTVRNDLDDAYIETLREQFRQLQFRGGVLLSARLGSDNSGADYVLRSPGTRRPGWRERARLAPRSSYSFTISPRDEAAANELSDLTNRGLNRVANAAAQAADHIESYFTMLRAELGFYVACLNLRSALLARGVPLSFPEPLPHEPFCFSCEDLRDTALVLQSADPVVGNDVEVDGRPLVVVTGANSGGKSTFLRSVGLAQLMLQCGMFVSASSYRASVRTAVFTHFGREEDASMRSGRLDDELRRMDAIVDAMSRDALVLFNESFAGTNEREGSEIGRQMVRALLERGVSVMFVTHQFDLAAGLASSMGETARFLRAERAPDGKPRFKLLVAGPLPTSFAVDVYRRIGGFVGFEGFAESSAARPVCDTAAGAPRPPDDGTRPGSIASHPGR
jgi:DNA mismatch repair ATPase MutS